MSVRILTDTSENLQVMYDSSTMIAFGPVLSDSDFDMEDFLEWLPKKATEYTSPELHNLFYKWMESVRLSEVEEEN